MAEKAPGARELRRPVQTEAAAWGVLVAINNAFISPLLISRGAGPIALALYNSGANLFGYGSGWAGPRVATRLGSVARATLGCLLLARVIFIALPIVMVATDSGAVPLLVAILLLWAFGEGLALPLWTAFLTGLVSASQRGRWLAMRATAATATSALVMVGLLILLQFTTHEQALPAAYALAAAAGLASLWQLRQLFGLAGSPPVPPARSVRAFPEEAETRRFLAGVMAFWFGAGLIWPVLPPYIIRELGAPTAYFAVSAVVAAGTGVLVQRFWGRVGDQRGARRVLLLGGIGAGIVPALWGVVPVYWLGIAVEVIASVCWPAHMMGLTLRSVELAPSESERPNLLAWTSLAQGTGAFVSPLVASLLVGRTGTLPILFASAAIRIGASVYLASPGRTRLATAVQSSPPTSSPSGQQ